MALLNFGLVLGRGAFFDRYMLDREDKFRIKEVRMLV
jgi:hypothetical protein